jgi:hypothetical protein
MDGGANMNNSIRDFVITHKSLFDEIAKKYNNMKDRKNVEYTILDYSKILNDISDYIEGYLKYREQGQNTYDGKVLLTTKYFYDGMFKPNSMTYRKIIALTDMNYINEDFLKGTKRLQTILDAQSPTPDDTEFKSILLMTDNQYKKISKVWNDDMHIYLWLSTSNSKIFCKKIDDETRRAFDDKYTPVMHKYLGEGND